VAEVSVWPEVARQSTGLEATAAAPEDRWSLEDEEAMDCEKQKSYAKRLN